MRSTDGFVVAGGSTLVKVQVGGVVGGTVTLRHVVGMATKPTVAHELLCCRYDVLVLIYGVVHGNVICRLDELRIQ